jgi:hypothetical protein
MPPGGGSTPGNIADGDVPWRRSRIFMRRNTEKMNPENLAFVCAVLGFGLCYHITHKHGLCLYNLFVFVYWDVAGTSSS